MIYFQLYKDIILLIVKNTWGRVEQLHVLNAR